jgi:hypothetical protein
MPEIPPKSIGILVVGDNHFIVRGPKPDPETAHHLARRWTLIEIGAPPIEGWTISSKEFRENLTWAIVLPGETAPSPAVTQLLIELKERGVEVRRLSPE